MRSAHSTITAIIPLFNGAAFVERALESVFSQSRPADEIIVVDDGSRDDGVEVARRAANGDRRTIFLRQENAGQSAARNAAARKAAGARLAFLDQDDWWYRDHLEKLEEPFFAHRRHPLGWVYSDLDEHDANGKIVTRQMLSGMATEHPKSTLARCLGENMFVVPSASLVDRAAFLSVGGFDERLSGYEDDDLFLRLFRAGFDNRFLPEALTAWRIHGESASYSPRMLRSASIYAEKLLGQFPDDPKLRRFYGRDVIAPRFLRTALGCYAESLQFGSAAEVDDALGFVDRLRPRLRRGTAWPLRCLRPFMKNRGIARATIALGLHRIVWKMIR